MCGIVGYVGNEQAGPILLDGLSRLEYRGYDSAGVAVYSQRDQRLSVHKAKGRLQVLSDMPVSYTHLAAAITSQTGKARLPTHIELAAQNYGLTRDSVVLLEQIRTLDKRRLREKMGRVDKELMDRVDAAIAVSFGLHSDKLV